MIKKVVVAVFFVLALGFVSSIGSENYGISVPTVADGGGNLISTNYGLKALIGGISGVINSATQIAKIGFWYTAVLDREAPTISIISPTNTTYTTSTIWFNATADEEIDTWIVNYNGTNVTHAINTSLEVEDGNFQLKLYANDTLGNWGLNDSIWFSVDTKNYTDSCGNLASANTIYYLNQSVTSTDTCFNIQANNITLDCNGYKINY